jgi:hypothetical protein
VLDINIFGDYDFAELATQPVTSVDPQVVLDAMRSFAGGVDQFLSEQTGLLTTESEKHQESFGQVDSGEFQAINDITTIEARKIGGSWQIGFPIYAKGDRMLYTQAWLDRATLADLNSHMVNVGITDSRTFIRDINRSLLFKTNYNFDDNVWPGAKNGTLKVKRLFNADGSDEGYVYTVDGREIAISALNHYLVSGSNTLNETAFSNAYQALRNVDHADDVVYLCSRTTADSAEALSNFIITEDKDVRDINKVSAIVRSPRARGRIQHGEVWEWPHFPDGYIFAFDRSKPKPARVRVSDLAKYRGLRLVQEDKTSEILSAPLLNKKWQRIYGVAVHNRANGVAVKITNSGSYSDPSTL